MTLSTIKLIDNSLSCLERLFSLFLFLIRVQPTCRPHRLDIEENTFSRKLRKLNSVLAAEASAKFSLLLQDLGCFDCRISQLPNTELVVDYFRWRQQDAYRNSLSSHCYWCLRSNGHSSTKATSMM